MNSCSTAMASRSSRDKHLAIDTKQLVKQELAEGKSGFVSHTKHTAEATFMDLFYSWLITCTMWFWEFETR